MGSFDLNATCDMLIRLLVASSLGSLLGFERQMHGRGAGIRTHLMVALGSAMFVATGIECTRHGAGPELETNRIADVTRVIQGIAAGVGFLGAGTILKLSDRLEIKGLTTASTIWLSAAIGTTAGMALYSVAVAGTVISLLVLAVLARRPDWLRDPDHHSK